MMSIRSKSLELVAVGISLLSAACADKELDNYQGNRALGIARFELSADAYETKLVGLDVLGAEVARLDVIHGRFTLSPTFAEDYGVAEIDGRKLSVVVGEQQLEWETGGYDPVLDLPAHPSTEGSLAMFLDDPHAKAVLDRWGIGFDAFEGGIAGDQLESSYTSGTLKGDSRQSCNNASACGTVRGLTINTCGGGAVATTAGRVTQEAGTNCGLYSSSYTQVHVAQCCPAGSGGQTNPWFARKTCAVATAGNCDPDGTGPKTVADGTLTECGCQANSVACKACPTYPFNAGWACSVASSGSAVGTCNGATVYPIDYVHYVDGEDWCSQYPGYEWCPDLNKCLTNCCRMCGSVCC